ncbi:MAG TPA: hypothetical protein PKC96_05720 [Bacilli bacterium]|jgi:hypothetical protein|nr:hypothetical protein [Bacilli bacterium]HMM00822.1 hypothetical protein [Bacilli bacterium]
MKKFKIKIKWPQIHFYHYLTLVLLLAILITIAITTNALPRLGLSLVYFGKVIGQWFLYIIDVVKEPVTINPPGYIAGAGIGSFTIPTDIKDLIYQLNLFSLALFNGTVIKTFLIKSLIFIIDISKWLVFIPYLFLVVFIIKKLMMKSTEGEICHDSKALKRFKRFESRFLTPVKQKLEDYMAFLRHYKAYLIASIVLLTLAFNVLAIALDIISWYINFTCTFDLASILIILASVILDIIPILFKLHWSLLLVIAVIMFQWLRIKDARQTISAMQEHNVEKASELKVATLVSGPPGIGKNLFVTSVVIDAEMLMRDKAFSIIKKYQAYFPFFPWAKFENWLNDEIYNRHTVVNRSQIKKAIMERWNEFIDKGSNDLIWGYDFNKYKLEFYDGLRVISLVDALIPYGQAYFLYRAPKALSAGNYSIQFNYLTLDGYFPLYSYRYIDVDNRSLLEEPKFATDANFDDRRILNKVNPGDNEGFFHMDGQVEYYTEIDKERGNKDDYVGMEKKDALSNQRNDGFNKSIKVTRHEYSIDGQPFSTLIMDTQRESSVNADLRDTCEDKVRIKKRSELQTAVPMFFIDYLLNSLIVERYIAFYYHWRNIRNTNTLTMYLIQKFIRPFQNYYSRIINKYSYQEMKYRHEIGGTVSEPGERTDQKYYFISKKLFGNTYATDCYSAIFDKQREEATAGFLDAPTYQTYRANIDELNAQDSYWIRELDTYVAQDKTSRKTTIYFMNDKNN